MSDGTGIEYLDATWNPVTGCTHVSEGCRNCWAERMAKRQNKAWGQVYLHPERLEQPLHWRRPRRVGVCFMGDLFHPSVPIEYMYNVMHAMEDATQHTFFVLTKRPDGIIDAIARLENVVVGVSVEDQVTAEERIWRLLATPSKHRWVSIEPMLGAVDLSQVGHSTKAGKNPDQILNALLGTSNMWEGAKIDWVVLGGESGPGARPMHPDWARSVRNRCVATGVPFFFKQWGDWAEVDSSREICDWMDGDLAVSSRGTSRPWTDDWDETEVHMRRIGKKRAGRELDGRTWDQLPILGLGS